MRRPELLQDRGVVTQVGRALAQLGIEHIAAYSPEARGRSERAFRTLQDRLPKELALAGITTVAAANAYLRMTYVAEHNRRFAVAAEQPVSRQPKIALWLVGRKVVEDDVDLAVRVVGHDRVHEVQELDAAASFVVAAGDLAAGDVQGCEQRRRPVPPLVVRLADHRAPGWQLEVSLRPLQRLDRRTLIDRQHHRILRRRHIQADDLGRLGHELRVGALAPGLAARKVDLLRAQETPDILLVDIAQCAGQQRPRPVRVALRRRLIEHGQDALLVRRAIPGGGPRSPVSSSPAKRSRA